jgi:hypothetical protein
MVPSPQQGLEQPPNDAAPPELYEGGHSFQPSFPAALLGAMAAQVVLLEEIEDHLVRIPPVTFLMM